MLRHQDNKGIQLIRSTLDGAAGLLRDQRLYHAPLALGLALALSACGGEQKAGPPAGGPPPEVAVLTVRAQSAPLTTELPGRVEASRVAQVRARVTGLECPNLNSSELKIV